MKEHKIRTSEDFTYLPITARTLEKIKGYAKLSGGFECYGFLLGSRENADGVVYNAMLARGQDVSGGHAKIDGNAAAGAKAEIINSGYKALGFWHSHGHHAAFHSGTDDANMNNLLLAFAGNSEERELIYVPKGIDIDGKRNEIIVRRDGREVRVGLENMNTDFEIHNQNGKQEGLSLSVSEDWSQLFIKYDGKCIVARKPRTIQISECPSKTGRKIGAAYSLVVNRAGDQYAEIAVNQWCCICDGSETKINKNVTIKPVEIEKDIEFDEKELLLDLEERVVGFKKNRKW